MWLFYYTLRILSFQLAFQCNGMFFVFVFLSAALQQKLVRFTDNH